MKIKYVGRHTGGIELADGQVVAHGAEVEVDDAVGESLLAQRDQFERVGSKTRSKTAREDPPESDASADDATPESES